MTFYLDIALSLEQVGNGLKNKNAKKVFIWI